MSLVTEEYELQYPDGTIYRAKFGTSEGQYSNAKSKIDKITIKNVFTTKRLFIKIFLRMKPVVMGDKGG